MIFYTRLERIDVDDLPLYQEGRLIGRWFAAMERHATDNTRDAAPLNKRPNKGRAAPPRGTLKAGITGRHRRAAARRLEATITSSAPYTMYVVGGTGTITAPFMALPINPGYPASQADIAAGYTAHTRVSGQKANNFFAAGIRRTSIRHQSLRGAAGSFAVRL